MIQLSNHLTSGTHLYASTRKQASGFGAASFQDTLKRNSDLSSKNLSQDMKKEIMHQFPGLTEERLNDLISHYDIENMNYICYRNLQKCMNPITQMKNEAGNYSLPTARNDSTIW